MIEILLKHGKVLLIDEIDVPLFNRYPWYASCERDRWYVKAPATLSNGRRSVITLHRLIITAQRGQWVDHKDGNGLNNTRDNLRLCTPSQNAQNQRRNTRNTSNYKGVSWQKCANKWMAYIKQDSKRRHLGLYADVTDAARAYDTAARELFGEFACLNFPDEL